jgi:adenosylcobinamide-phosphate synthase
MLWFDMPMGTVLLVAMAALGIEAAFGYPLGLYRRIGHPVTWIGTLVGALDRGFNRYDMSGGMRRAMGVLALILIVAIPAFIAWMVERFLAPTWLGSVGIAVLASTLVASRSLFDHVRNVASALDAGGVEPARQAVGQIVGRDPQTLDAHGVARAAIESLAENASDGVVAPVFWFVVLGLPGLAAYKAINTADSMIGHKSVRHADFGWAAARLDDLVNLPASRLTALLIAVTAFAMPWASSAEAFRAMVRDASRHRSPNAGWPESAMAGALHLKLNGPKVYGGTLVADAYMGDGRQAATAQDIRKALRLAAATWLLMVAALAMGAIMLQG